MSETIVLDPAAIVTDTTRTQVDITQYIKGPEGIDWGDAAIQAYLADNFVGSSMVDYRIPNRSIKIPLVLKGTTFSAVRQTLQQKVGLFQRERGSILRQIGANPYYADIQNATLHLGGSSYQARSTPFDVDATLELEVLPDWYGAEQTLTTISGTGYINGKLQQSGSDAIIAGNYPGRVRLVLSDTSANDQKGLIWGFRSRRYDSAASAALFYEAEAMTLLNGATSTAAGSASGGHMATLTLPPSGVWVPHVMTTLSAGPTPLTHKGTYRVWARVFCGGANIASFRLLWGVGSLSTPFTNDAVTPSGAIATFGLVDLGVVQLTPSPVGTHQWFGVIQSNCGSSGSPSIDCVYLQPVEEYSGKLIYTPASSTPAISAVGYPSLAVDDATVGTVAWTGVTSVYQDDGNTAWMNCNHTNISHYIKATGFNFAIPSGATIVGVGMNLRRGASYPNLVFDYAVRLVKGGAIQATDRSNPIPWGTPNNYIFSYGGPTDMWGTTLLYSDVNAATFGVAVSCQNLSATNDTYIDIDFISLTVWYTLGTGFTVTPDVVIKASSTAELRTDGMVRDGGSGIYGQESQVIGDLPRIPPSGIENRPCELFVKNTRGDLGTGALADQGLDGISAVVKYKPSFLYIGT